MHKESKKLFTPDVLHQAIEKFGFKDEEVKLLNGFESFIYEVKHNGQNLILRITHSLHRSANEIEAEVDWVNYLIKGGVPAAKAFKSKNGNLVEIIELENSYFLAIVFEQFSGRHVRNNERDEVVYEQLGQIIGRIHHLTKNFKFSDPNFNRREWSSEIEELFQFLPKQEQVVDTEIKAIFKKLKELPRDSDSFGLIHTDAHFGNLFLHDGKLKIFDFDDSCFMWFISDIAIVIFYSLMGKHKDLTQKRFIDMMMKSFMRGYRKENQIENFWIDQIPLFLKLREVELYLVIHRSFDVNNLEDPWCKWYMEGRKEKIEQGVPYIDFDFSKFKD